MPAKKPVKKAAKPAKSGKSATAKSKTAKSATSAKSAKAAAKSAKPATSKSAKAKAPKAPVPAKAKAPTKAKAQKPVAKPAQAAAKPAVKAKAPAPKPSAKTAVQAKAAVPQPQVAAPVVKPAADAVKPVVQAKPAVAAAPAKPVFKPAPAAPAKPAAEARPADGVRNNNMTSDAAKKTIKHGFKTNEHIVYPAHGVGQIVAIEEQEIAGYKLELFVITFAKDKMTLRVPISKIASVGMRKLSAGDIMTRALDTLKGRARVKRTMWSRRAQEYEAKINSGDLVAIAEVVRDLHRAETQPEQSYSERQLYEAALDRMARELAAVEKLTESEAVKKIEAMLAKGPKRGAAKTDDAEGEGEAEAAAPEGDEAEAA